MDLNYLVQLYPYLLSTISSPNLAHYLNILIKQDSLQDSRFFRDQCGSDMTVRVAVYPTIAPNLIDNKVGSWREVEPSYHEPGYNGLAFGFGYT